MRDTPGGEPFDVSTTTMSRPLPALAPASLVRCRETVPAYDGVPERGQGFHCRPLAKASTCKGLAYEAALLYPLQRAASSLAES
jgi:hypothetical protein